MSESLGLTVQQLRYFLAIESAGSISEAARQLGVSKGTLARVLSQAEEKLGFPLFEGSRKGAFATPNGGRFLDFARKVVFAMDQLDETFADHADEAESLRISTVPVGVGFQAIKATAAASPESNDLFFLGIENAPQIIEDVAEGRKDIGILQLSQTNRSALTEIISINNLEFHPILETKTYAFASEDSPLANRSSVTMSQLALYPTFDLEHYIYFRMKHHKDIRIASSDLGGNTDALYDQFFEPMTEAVADFATGSGCFTYCAPLLETDSDAPAIGDSICIPISDAEPNTIGYVVKKDAEQSDLTRRYIIQLESLA